MSIPAAFWLALAAAAAPADVHPGLPSAAAWRSAPAVAEAARTRIDRQHTILVTNASPFYAPARLTVRVGETVRWRNGRSSDRHSVRETLHGTFSLEIPPGEEVGFRFAHPGEYHYQCRFHPWMHGTVFVEPALLTIEWRSLSADLRGARL
ncbi:MAG TPA: cupredoxin domain-containing protein, partial [Thermoanaerobaculia bacterium]|nr:cupredoxin domain-containing protein [Thermoanaerobaculia bacterium]